MSFDLMFSAPDTAQREPAVPKITHYEGLLMLVRPFAVRPFRHPDGKEVSAIHADVWLMEGPDAPFLVRGLTIPQSALVSALRRHLPAQDAEPGPGTLTRLGQEPNRVNPDMMVWVFQQPTPEDVDFARVMVEEHGNPFAGQ